VRLRRQRFQRSLAVHQYKSRAIHSHRRGGVGGAEPHLCERPSCHDDHYPMIAACFLRPSPHRAGHIEAIGLVCTDLYDARTRRDADVLPRPRRPGLIPALTSPCLQPSSAFRPRSQQFMHIDEIQFRAKRASRQKHNQDSNTPDERTASPRNSLCWPSLRCSLFPVRPHPVGKEKPLAQEAQKA